jgi:hypothetical protein
MNPNTRARRRLAIAGAIAALTIVASVPATASGQVGDVLNGLGLGQSGVGNVGGAPDGAAGNPHAQGTVGAVDVQSPSGAEALLGSEEAVVGRSGAQQNDDGSYQGGVTILGLLGEEILGVDTSEGQTAHSPLQPIQEGLLDPICAGSQGTVCLSVLVADSSSAPNGSTNDFGVLRADSNLGGKSTSAGVAESSGNLTEDGNCQTATASSGVARADVLEVLGVRILQSEASDTACNDGTTSQSGDGTVASVNGNDLPLPAGCDGAVNGGQQIATVAGVSCNAAAANGDRSAVGVDVLPGSDVAGNGTAASSSTGAEAPDAGTAQGPGDDGTPGGPTGDDDTPGANGPNGPGAGDDTSTGAGGGAGSAAGESQAGNGGALAFTGANLTLLALIGFGLVALGIGIASRRPRARASIS